MTELINKLWYKYIYDIYCALQEPTRALTSLNVRCTFNTGLVSRMPGHGGVVVSGATGERRNFGKSEGGGPGVLWSPRPPGQIERQGCGLLVLTRMIDWLPGANPCQFPHLSRLRIRTGPTDGGSLGRVVTVVVTELVLFLGLGVGIVLEISEIYQKWGLLVIIPMEFSRKWGF